MYVSSKLIMAVCEAKNNFFKNAVNSKYIPDYFNEKNEFMKKFNL